MKALMFLSLGLMVGVSGAVAHGDELGDPNILGRSLASRVIDYSLVFGASAGLQAVSAATIGVPSFEWFADRSWLLSAWAMGTMSLPMWTYNTALVAGPHQATLGHRAVGVSAVGLDGQPVSAGRSLLRSAVMFLGWELAHIALFVPRNFAIDEPAPWQWVGIILANAYLMADITAIVATGGRRSIADFAVGTRLVRSTQR